MTRVPQPFAGGMNPSPQGRFPKAPVSVSSPASGIAVRPLRSRCRSLPFGQVITASEAASMRSATAAPLRRSSAMSALITRASISSVTPAFWPGGRMLRKPP